MYKKLVVQCTYRKIIQPYFFRVLNHLMAELIFNQDDRLNSLTSGEKRLAKVLKAKLEDDYLVWCNVPVGSPPRYPDFIVLHPRRGLLILEVKDWKLDTIQNIDKFEATLLIQGKPKKQSNPLEQARQYLLPLVNKLATDPLLTYGDSHQHQGKPCFPYGYGAVFSNITRQQFDSTDIGEAIDPDRVICQDEMRESVDPEAFQTRLWNCFPYYFDGVLSLPQIDRIRWHIFPDIRVTQGTLFPETEFDASDDDSSLPSIVQVMDVEQEKLSRRMGEGHRVIHGVAGSGKTMILGYRCAYLSKTTAKPILVLCYNVTLAAKLQWLIRDKGITDRVNVCNFHSWCDEQLRLYHIRKPAPGEQYFEQLVTQVIEATERGQIPTAQYGAVLIDEAHDFDVDWLKLVVQMIDPETNALLVLYDDAQSIYRRKQLGFNLSDAGIQARGRTKILKINYRNTAEVLAVAYEFAKELFAHTADSEAMPIIEPTLNIGRHGPVPELTARSNLAQEVDYIAGRLQDLKSDGLPWNDMAILYRTKFMGERICERLAAANIPVEWLNRDTQSRRYAPDQASVKVMTMHSSKGLEFPTVAIPGLGYMPHQHGDPHDEAKLLYVAMTRAMDQLIMTYHKPTVFTERLSAARDRVAA